MEQLVNIYSYLLFSNILSRGVNGWYVIFDNYFAMYRGDGGFSRKSYRLLYIDQLIHKFTGLDEIDVLYNTGLNKWYWVESCQEYAIKL